MKTFIGEYKNGSYIMSGDDEVLRAQLVTILNTPIGSRFYYPSFGSNLKNLRFSVLNYYTINIITQTIKDAVDLIDGVKLAGISYSLSNNNTIQYIIDLDRLSTKYRINLSVSDGVAS